MTNRATRRQQTRVVRDAIRTALPETEQWERIEGPAGFEYRHVTAQGKRFTVRGIWPRAAAVGAAIAAILGLLIGHAVR
jgi:hypothetical protein